MPDDDDDREVDVLIAQLQDFNDANASDTDTPDDSGDTDSDES